MAMFRPPKEKEEKKPSSNPDGEAKEEVKQEQKQTAKRYGGIRTRRGRLTAEDIVTAIISGDVTIANLLDPHPVSLSTLLNPHPVSLSTLLNPHPVTQLTRTNLLTKPEREDLVSLGGVVSPNNAGVLIVTGVAGQKIKVYDAGYHAGAEGLHYFYFGTTTSATTKRFLTNNKDFLAHKTFVHPRIGAAGDSLYLFSAVAETNMPYDIGYVIEA
jgi:hypothetical protein